MKKSFIKSKRLSADMSLQITSMADIFMIILVFLLKSFAAGTVELTPTQGLTLPVADAGPASAQALRVEVAENAILVESEPVVKITGFAMTANDVQPNGTSKQLTAALEKYRQRQLMIAKANSDVKLDPKIIVVADQRAPYSTIKSVLASAAVNGYTDFKLAVVNNN